MLFDNKTQNNVMIDLVATVDSDISTEEGTLINHSLRAAAAEFEQAYIGLGIIDQNGYAETADREHLILRAKERGITPFPATNAVWRAVFNIEIPLNARFSSGNLTFVCTEQMENKVYRLTCEQMGIIGNAKQGELNPIEYISDYDTGELTELITPARDEEDTETFRTRYFSIVAAAQAFGGNRAQYKQVMHDISGVGACKIYRVAQGEKRIKIYFLDNRYETPNETLISDVQETIDPIGKQGEGEGKAAIFHVIDIFPCISEAVNVEANITIDTGYFWEDLIQEIQGKVDNYLLELAKGWENEEYITVRILKLNAAIASVEGIVDVQNTALNGIQENLILDPNAIPIRGEIIRRS